MTRPLASDRRAAFTRAAAMSLAALGLAALGGQASAEPPKLGLPAACRLGEDCFVQQFADIDPSPKAEDPFCGAATYDGHDGIDLRVRSMADVARGVDVVAVADGIVLRLRDGEPDHLVRSDADRAAVKDKECGNGLLLQHTDGVQTQYCHLRQGSLVVRPGDRVTRGQKLGSIGASGMAAFPHVHLTVRRDGQTVEPMTGKPLAGAACVADAAAGASLFEPAVFTAMGHGQPQFIGAGIASGPVNETALVDQGLPPPPTDETPVVAWGWAINLAKGDVMTVRLMGPDGAVLAEQASPPVDHTKATYIAYSGLKHGPRAGSYTVETAIKRGEAIIAFKVARVDIH